MEFDLVLTFEVPNPHVGFVFFWDNVWTPKELGRGPVAGPGEVRPKVAFPCSLEMKTCSGKQRAQKPGVRT